MSSLSCGVPSVCSFAYINYKTKKDGLKLRHFANCKFCKDGITISDTVPTTTNFVRHLKRKHKKE